MSQWRDLFPNVVLKNYSQSISDHCSLVLNTYHDSLGGRFSHQGSNLKRNGFLKVHVRRRCNDFGSLGKAQFQIGFDLWGHGLMK